MTTASAGILKVANAASTAGASDKSPRPGEVLDVISFEASDMKKQRVIVDADYVRNTLTDTVKDQYLSRNVL